MLKYLWWRPVLSHFRSWYNSLTFRWLSCKSFLFGLNKILTEGSDKNLLMTGAGGCPPLIGIDMGYTYVHGSDLKCYQRTNEHFSNLLKKYKIEHVYLAFDEEGLFDERFTQICLVSLILKPIVIRQLKGRSQEQWNFIRNKVLP